MEGLCDDVVSVVFEFVDIVTLRNCFYLCKNIHAIIHPILDEYCKKIIQKFPQKCVCGIVSQHSIVVVPPLSFYEGFNMKKDNDEFNFLSYVRMPIRYTERVVYVLNEKIKLCGKCNQIVKDEEGGTSVYPSWMYVDGRYKNPIWEKTLFSPKNEIVLTTNFICVFEQVLSKLFEMCKPKVLDVDSLQKYVKNLGVVGITFRFFMGYNYEDNHNFF